MWSLGLLGLRQYARIGLAHHLLAVVNAHQVVLIEAVVEHILGSLAEIEYPFADRWWFDTIGHVLRVNRAGGVVITADAADTAGDKMGVAGIFALHKQAVATKDRRGAAAFYDLSVLEVDLGVDAQAADNACYWVPRHIDKLWRRAGRIFSSDFRTHDVLLSLVPSLVPMGFIIVPAGIVIGAGSPSSTVFLYDAMTVLY